MIELGGLQLDGAKPPAKQEPKVAHAEKMTLPKLALLFELIGFPVHISQPRKEYIYADPGELFYDDEEESAGDDSTALSRYAQRLERWSQISDRPRRISTERLFAGTLSSVRGNPAFDSNNPDSVRYYINLADLGEPIPMLEGDTVHVRGYIGTSRNLVNRKLDPDSKNLSLHMNRVA